jgi:hypothetical protein
MLVPSRTDSSCVLPACSITTVCVRATVLPLRVLQRGAAAVKGRAAARELLATADVLLQSAILRVGRRALVGSGARARALRWPPGPNAIDAPARPPAAARPARQQLPERQA